MEGIIVSLGNLVFYPLLDMDPVYAVVILSSFLSLIFSLANKVMVNQDKLKHVKSEMKKIQQEIKKARKKNNEKELSKLWEKSMKMNHQQLTMVLKPMVVSMLLIFMVFPWMRFTYGDVVSPVNDSSFIFERGDYENEFSVNMRSDDSVAIKDMSSGKSYVPGDIVVLDEREWTVRYDPPKDEEGIAKFVFSSMKVKLPISIPFVGDAVGWLGFYILVSIPTTIVFRKLLGVQ
ncbi:MAG: EMC3/TMCO1 family protein [archaeon]|nr:EMC3/TMCO1 family protein [archaeon]